jgi:succinoglycan biosynthesis protein ExoO
MNSVLICSPYLPNERVSGSITRVNRVLERLNDFGFQLHFVLVTRRGKRHPRGGSWGDRLASVHVLEGVGSQPAEIQPIAWRHLTRPPRYAKLWSWLGAAAKQDKLPARLHALLDCAQANVIWINHSSLLPLLAHLPRGRPLLKIVDTHDCMHQRDASFVAAGLSPEFGVTREQEARLLRQCDLVVAIQDRERQEFARMLPHTKVVTVAHAVGVDPQRSRGPDVCFVGSRYIVNERSLLEFLNRAWPAIRERCPQSRLQVVGDVGQCERVVAAAQRDASIVIRGIVTPTRDIYDGPAVVVCPMWIGSGLKIKLVEALAHGKAIVASPVAAQGLEDGANRAFVLAETPEAFVEPVIRLIECGDERRQLEWNAAVYANRRFSEVRVWHDLREALAQWQTSGQQRCAA